VAISVGEFLERNLSSLMLAFNALHNSFLRNILRNHKPFVLVLVALNLGLIRLNEFVCVAIKLFKSSHINCLGLAVELIAANLVGLHIGMLNRLLNKCPAVIGKMLGKSLIKNVMTAI
jgi:hypothetical protein